MCESGWLLFPRHETGLEVFASHLFENLVKMLSQAQALESPSQSGCRIYCPVAGSPLLRLSPGVRSIFATDFGGGKRLRIFVVVLRARLQAEPKSFEDVVREGAW